MVLPVTLTYRDGLPVTLTYRDGLPVTLTYRDGLVVDEVPGDDDHLVVHGGRLAEDLDGVAGPGGVGGQWVRRAVRRQREAHLKRSRKIVSTTRC